MPTAKERLSHLIALAGEGPAERAALVGELADLVLDWPPDCPAAMRPPVVALLELTVRETGEDMRAKLAARLGGHGELPLALVNEFYLVAPGRVRREILMRNELEDGAVEPLAPPDATGLLAAARQARQSDFDLSFAAALGIAPRIAGAILGDASGEALAVLCKGAHLDRALFSALAVLHGQGEADARLAAYDSVPQRAAERLTQFWQSHAEQSGQARAAE